MLHASYYTLLAMYIVGSLIYLFIGSRLGSLGWNILHCPNDYCYVLRLLMYPHAVIYSGGWLNEELIAPSGDLTCFSVDVVTVNALNDDAFGVLAPQTQRAVYIVLLSFFWFPKLVFNIACLVLIYAATVLWILCAFFMTFGFMGIVALCLFLGNTARSSVRWFFLGRPVVESKNS